MTLVSRWLAADGFFWVTVPESHRTDDWMINVGHFQSVDRLCYVFKSVPPELAGELIPFAQFQADSITDRLLAPDTQEVAASLRGYRRTWFAFYAFPPSQKSVELPVPTQP